MCRDEHNYIHEHIDNEMKDVKKHFIKTAIEE
jgi:hypothetical protein